MLCLDSGPSRSQTARRTGMMRADARVESAGYMLLQVDMQMAC